MLKKRKRLVNAENLYYYEIKIFNKLMNLLIKIKH